jgi:hypothetical protein
MRSIPVAGRPLSPVIDSERVVHHEATTSRFANDSQRVRMLQDHGRGGEARPGMAAERSLSSEVPPRQIVNRDIGEPRAGTSSAQTQTPAPPPLEELVLPGAQTSDPLRGEWTR